MGLSMAALLIPNLNGLAFKVAQPAVLPEDSAVISWLIIFGVRVQTIERRVVLPALKTASAASQVNPDSSGLTRHHAKLGTFAKSPIR